MPVSALNRGSQPSMRSLLHIHSGQAPPPQISSSPSSARFSDCVARESVVLHSASVTNVAFDLAALSIIAGLLLLSCLALTFIFHFHVRSRRAHHLQNFNSLWTVRLLLVLFASLWAIDEMLRLQFVRRNHLIPFWPSFERQSDICKLHVVLSLGFLEPGFLITLFYLLNVSIKNRSPSRLWSLGSLFTFCSPIILLQTFFVYFSPWKDRLPEFMHRSTVLSADHAENKTVLCTYPFFSWIIFGAFAVAYGLAFLLSCWRVMEFVINKGIGHRVYILAATVVMALSVQIVCLCLSALWAPGEVRHGCVVLVTFLCVAWCMAVAEVLLVLTPIRDALAAGGECCQWSPDLRRTSTEEKERGSGL